MDDYDVLMDEGYTLQECRMLSVYGATQRGVCKKDALKEFGIDEEEYDGKIRELLRRP